MNQLKKESGRKKGGFDWGSVRLIVGLLLWAGVSVVAAQFVVGFLMVWLLGEAVGEPLWTMVHALVTYGLGLFLVIFVPWKMLKMKTNREELGLVGLPTWTDIGLAPVGFVVYFGVAMLVMAVASSLLPGVNWEQAQQIGFDNVWMAGIDKIWAFVTLVVIAPVAEEVIFRGWLYGKVRARVPAWVGALAVSLLFGLMHLGWDVAALQWNAALNIFCMSVVLCVMREITGTIWSGVILHMLKNGVAFYLLFVTGM